VIVNTRAESVCAASGCDEVPEALQPALYRSAWTWLNALAAARPVVLDCPDRLDAATADVRGGAGPPRAEVGPGRVRRRAERITLAPDRLDAAS
jgi:hypothetical protein